MDSCKILKDTILNTAEDGTLVLEEITLRECRLTKDHFFILADCIANLKMVDLSVSCHSGLEGVNAVKENIKAASMKAAQTATFRSIWFHYGIRAINGLS